MPRKPLLIVLGVVALAGVAYFFMSSGGGEDLPLTATPAASPTEQQFLDLATKLTPISFDISIFENQNFGALVDLATEITAENFGRVDPFAALGR